MQNLPPLPGPGAGIGDWIAWGILVVVLGVGFLLVRLRDSRGPVADRLNAALADERQSHRETKAELAEALRLLEESRQQNNALIREFADNKAQMARMEMKIGYLTEEITELKAKLGATP